VEELLPFLVLIGIGVMNAIAQKKKKEQRMGRKPGAPPRPPRGEGRFPSEPPDATRTPPLARPGADSEEEEDSSEGMIPADVWEEILGLARGQPASTKPKGRPAPTEAEEPERLETREVAQVPMETVEAREVRPAPKARVFPESHGARAALHTAPAEDFESRLGVEKASALEAEEGEERPRVRVELFGDGSKEELRKAVVLTEVLGPPLSVRED
jgi:hypothetical protein